MTTESSSTQTNSGTQSGSGFSQSPFGRLGDAVGTENLPGFPGGGGQNGGTQSGGAGGNSFAGGGAPVSPFDQIRYNIDQAIYNAFPPGGGTPDANTSIDTSRLNPFNQPPGGGSQPSTDSGSQVGGPEGASFGGYNPFDPGFGSNVSNQAIQASQGGGNQGGGFSIGNQGGGFSIGNQGGGFSIGNQGGGFSTSNQGGGFSTGSQGGGFGGGDSNQAGSPFASNPQANQIDATRAELSTSVTELINSGDTDSIESQITSRVSGLVDSLTGSTLSSTLVEESAPVTEVTEVLTAPEENAVITASETTVIGNSAAPLDIPSDVFDSSVEATVETFNEPVAGSAVNAGYPTEEEFFAIINGGELNLPEFLSEDAKAYIQGQVSTIAGIIGEYQQLGGSFTNGSNPFASGENPFGGGQPFGGGENPFA